MAQSGGSGNVCTEELLADWGAVDVDDDDVYRAWRSERLATAVEIGNVADAALVVEVRQDVAVDGFESSVVSHLAMCDDLADACSTAVDFMLGASAGSYALEPLCAVVRDDLVDFVCAYVDDLHDAADLDRLRAIVEARPSGEADERAVGDLADDAGVDVPEIAIDAFPKPVGDVGRAGG